MCNFKFFNRSLQEVLNCKAGDVEELHIYFSVSNSKKLDYRLALICFLGGELLEIEPIPRKYYTTKICPQPLSFILKTMLLQNL